MTFSRALGFFAVFASFAAACSSAKLLGAGAACFQSVECGDGLACVPNDPMRPDAGSTCTNDLTRVVNVTADSGPPMEGGMVVMDGSMDSGGMMDTGVVMDSGVPMDSGGD